jgi:hypothetical protein
MISRRGEVIAIVRQRNQHRPAPATSTLAHVASCIGRASCIDRRRSAYPFAPIPPRTYVASFQDAFKHHAKAMTNAKHPAPEDAADL